MWNKVTLSLLFFTFGHISNAQDFLGKTKTDIERFVKDNQAVAIGTQRNDSSIVFQYEEEDERNRMFEVTCEFIFDQETCIAYDKIVAIHEYWAKTIQDLAALKKAKGKGEVIGVDGENLYSLYEFDEGYIIRLTLKDDRLIERFEYLNPPGR